MSHPLAGRLIAAEAAAKADFWAKVNMLGDCWEWTGTRSERGYGRLRYCGHDFTAHRCSYEYAFGRLPEGHWVLHKCDNPPCVNPSHLFLGFAKDNTADMWAKGRNGVPRAPGEKNRNAKLTTQKVVDIRNRAAKGESPAELAQAFSITTGCINQVIRGRTWAHAPGPINQTDRRGRWRRKAS